MKTFALSILLLVPAFLCAQENAGRDSYQAAERAYRDGQLQTAASILLEAMSSYGNALLPNACRLLALCHLALDHEEDAARYVRLLLRYNPYYTVSLDDPARFADLVNKYKNGGKKTLVTASQLLETPEEAPVPVTLITEDMLKAAGVRTLKEALIAYVPGMTDIESNEETNIAMRGVYSSGQEKILIMLDGHRMNSYSTNTSRPDFSISLDKVKQIEVLRGPASSLYGDVALTAVVNIITKSGYDINGVQLSAGAGNYGQLKGGLLFGKQYLDWSIMGWLSCYNATGEKVNIPTEEQKGTLPVPGNIVIGGFNRKPSFDVGLNISWKNFALSYNTTFGKTVAPYSMSYFFAPYSYEKYRTFKGNAPGFAKLSHHLEASMERQWNKYSLRAALTFDAEDQSRYQIAGDTIPDVGYNTLYPIATNDSVFLCSGVFQYHNWQETTWGISLRGNYQYQFNNGNKGVISAGMQWNLLHVIDSYYLEGDHYNRILVTYDESKNMCTGRETNANAYLQLKHQWRDWFILNLGVRYDIKQRLNGKLFHEVSPRIAFILLRPGWNLKLSYAKSFVDAPYFYRNNTLDTTTGGENLLSEYLHSVQLTFSANNLLHGLECDANLFYNQTKNFIIPNGLVYSNAGNLENMGIELSSSYSCRKFNSWFNFAWQHVLSSRSYYVTQHAVYDVPSVTSNFVFSYEIVRNIKFNTHLNVISKQVSLYEAPDIDGDVQSEKINIPARMLWNGGLTYKRNQFEFGVQIHNILNKHCEQGGTSVAPIRQQGLWYAFNFSYHFN